MNFQDTHSSHPEPEEGIQPDDLRVSPSHSQTSAPDVQTLAKELDRVLGELKDAVSNPAWGDKRGLIAVIGRLDLDSPQVFSRCASLHDTQSRLLSAFTRISEQEELPEKLAVFLFRHTILSDSFVSSLCVSDKLTERLGGTNGEGPVLSWDRALSAFAAKHGASVCAVLRERDEEELADQFQNLVNDLSSDESDDLSRFRVETSVHFFNSAFEVLSNGDQRFRKIVQSWLEDRKQLQECCRDTMRVLSGDSTVSSPSAAPAAPIAKKEVPKKQSSAKAPQVQLPRQSLLDGIGGVENIGTDDTRRGPVRSGNTGGDKDRGKSQFFREQDARRAAKEADRAARMAAAGIKANPNKTQHELNRKIGGKKPKK